MNNQDYKTWISPPILRFWDFNDFFKIFKFRMVIFDQNSIFFHFSFLEYFFGVLVKKDQAWPKAGRDILEKKFDSTIEDPRFDFRKTFSNKLCSNRYILW